MTVLRVLLVLLACIVVTSGESSNKQTLSSYCADQVAGKYIYHTSAKVQEYFRQCRDIENYVTCILKEREKTTPPAGVEIQPFEVKFPSEHDMELAGFYFCIHKLTLLQRAFTGMNKTACDQKYDPKPCKDKFITPAAVDTINQALKGEDSDKINNASCAVAAPYIECREKTFVECNQDFEITKHYELAKLGASCLIKMNIHSPYVTIDICEDAGMSIHKGENRVVLIAMMGIAAAIPLTST